MLAALIVVSLLCLAAVAWLVHALTRSRQLEADRFTAREAERVAILARQKAEQAAETDRANFTALMRQIEHDAKTAELKEKPHAEVLAEGDRVADALLAPDPAADLAVLLAAAGGGGGAKPAPVKPRGKRVKPGP